MDVVLEHFLKHSALMGEEGIVGKDSSSASILRKNLYLFRVEDKTCGIHEGTHHHAKLVLGGSPVGYLAERITFKRRKVWWMDHVEPSAVNREHDILWILGPLHRCQHVQVRLRLLEWMKGGAMSTVAKKQQAL